METEPTRMCELLVGLPAVRVLGVVDDVDGPLWVHIETVSGRPACAGCGRQAVIKDRDVIELVDLPAFGRRARLAWRKHRWCCPAADCPVGLMDRPRPGDRRTAAGVDGSGWTMGD